MTTRTLAKVSVVLLAATALWLARSVFLTSAIGFREWYQSLGHAEKIALISTVVLAVTGLLPFLRTLYESRRSARRVKAPYRILAAADELFTELGVPADRLQDYVEREALVKAWGKSLVPQSNKVILFGASGVGKSREAMELIKRLSRAEKPKIAYRQGEAIRPLDGPSDLANKVLLFIDDVRLEEAARIEQSEEDFSDERVGKNLQSTVRFFEKEYPILKVVLTMPKRQFEALCTARPKFAAEFQAIEIKEMDRAGLEKCARQQAKKLGCEPVEPNATDILAATDAQPLLCIYDFFTTMVDVGKREFSAQDVKQYCDLWREDRKNASARELKPRHRAVVDAVSCLIDFEIEPKRTIVELMFYRMSARTRFFTSIGREFERALTYLSRRYLTISKDGTVNLGGYPFTARRANDPARRKDLLIMLEVARGLKARRFWRRAIVNENDALEFLNKLTSRLNRSRMRDAALEVASIARTLSPNDSRAIFQTGLTVLGMGEKYEAENWFLRALAAEPEPKYASHIRHRLAKLYLSDSREEEALNLLDQAYAADPLDLLTISLKLDTLRESDVLSRAAVRTYREIQQKLSNTKDDLVNRLSAELACILFCVAYKKERRKPAPVLLRLTRRVRAIIDDAPVDQKKRAVLAHNLAVLCIDQAKIDERNKESYLDQAHACLEHAIDLDPFYGLAWAQVQSYETNWDVLPENEFWSEARRVLDVYYAARRTGTDSVSQLHSSKVHHATASFLWHIEMKAYMREFKAPPKFVSALEEFDKSLEIEKLSKEYISPALREHLVLVYLSLGEYLMVLSVRKPQLRVRARACLTKSFELSRGGESTISLRCKNSYAASFLGRLFYEAGDLKTAKAHVNNAIRLSEKNEYAWYLLAKVAENERDFERAFTCYEKNADLQQIAHVYSSLRTWREHLVHGGLLQEDLAANLRLSEKAYVLDPEGNDNVKHLFDYAYDERRFCKSTGSANGIAHAKKMLTKARQKTNKAYDITD